MIRNNKIAVFIGDYFWSSVPYDGLNLYHELAESDLNVELLMFDRDIRLNKKFSGNEKFHFNKDFFTKVKNLKTLKSWDELIKVSKDYSLIISSAHVAPKTRYPQNLHLLKCKWAAWDIGGVDLLVYATPDNQIRMSAPNYFFLKGESWVKWISEIKGEDKIDYAFASGCPHYDYYLDDADLKYGKPLLKNEFILKYGLDKNKNFILVTPSNPAASKHGEQFDENEHVLSFLNNESCKYNTQVLLKTYPHDYVFNEAQSLYSGIYHRKFYKGKTSQYEYIKKVYPNIKVIDSQDHFAAVKHSQKVFNISGSSISWETYFTESKVFSMNYSNKQYFNSLSYLPNIQFPDKSMNHEIFKVEDIFNNAKVDKTSCKNFILKEFSLRNIKKILLTKILKQE